MSGGGSFGKSESESDSNSKFQQDIWEGQIPALQNLYNTANSVFNQQYGGINSQIPYVTNQTKSILNQTSPYWQNQMEGGAYQDMGLQNTLMNSLNNSFANPSAKQSIYASMMGGNGNDYKDALSANYLANAQGAKEMANAGISGEAGAVGQSGSSRQGVAEGISNASIANQLATNLNQLGYDTFDKDLQNKLNIAELADSNTLARQQMLSGMIGQQQATQNTGLANSANMQGLSMGVLSPYSAPFNALGNYANVIGRPTVLGSGSMIGSSDAKGFGMSGYGGAG